MTPSDFDLLAVVANYIKPDLVKENTSWIDSPFEWVLSLPAGTKGKLGKQLIYQWCALKELSVNGSPDSEADMLINLHRVEVKFSTLWKVGIYKFQQFRDQNYEYSICLGISPYEAHCWVISKHLLKQHVIGHMGQHTGSAGKETAWLAINPNCPPEWLLSCGGNLNSAYIILKSLSRKRE
jgi:hypothetical protein